MIGSKMCEARLWRTLVTACGVTTVMVLGSAGAAGAASWTIQRAPVPSGATSSVLKDVSCASDRACIAVGSDQNAAGATVMLAERWNGGRRENQHSPNWEIQHGRGWEIQHTPNPSGATLSVLNGVSCTSRWDCTAVGRYQDSTGSFNLVERWNGARWEIQHAPSPADATSSELDAVSCTSEDACTAVGSYDSSSQGQVRGATLAVRWNGADWTVQSTPSLPPGPVENLFEGVSCSSRTACVAVGITITSGGNTNMAEVWNGAGWTVENPISPSDQDSFVSRVSCPSVTFCIAAGGYNNGQSELPLPESWNGSSWTVQSTPNQAESSWFNSVSCPWRTACTAVGTSFTSGGTATLAETWDGTSWAIQDTPNPPGATTSELSGVSCVSPRSCTAVGYDLSGSTSNPTTLLVERYS